MITGTLLQRFDGRGRVFLLILALVGVLVPLCQSSCCPRLGPAMSPLISSRCIGKYLCFALLAVSLDLVWGYCGILSLGHGAFLRAGGLCHGHVSDASDRPRGVYAHPVLPDFMVFLNMERNCPSPGGASTISPTPC
jgi:urea transport system permease protein